MFGATLVRVLKYGVMWVMFIQSQHVVSVVHDCEGEKVIILFLIFFFSVGIFFIFLVSVPDSPFQGDSYTLLKKNIYIKREKKKNNLHHC